MSNKNKNSAAPGVAELQSAYDVALEEFNGLGENTSAEELADAQQKVDSAKEILDAAVEAEKAAEKPKEKAKEKKLKVKFLLSPTGRFNLAYNEGEEALLPELQAEELVEAGYCVALK